MVWCSSCKKSWVPHADDKCVTCPKCRKKLREKRRAKK